ncbi:MAG: LamG-like jellyroll fold domain-containing protein [Solirubrobacterales bacterium]
MDAARQYGQALEFDGENDCVKIANTEDLQLDEEFTLEAWVRPQNLNKFTPIFFKESGTVYSYSLFLGAFTRATSKASSPTNPKNSPKSNPKQRCR